ncbi:19234_t:CDS:2 [Gigaspora margarita]|uniref:19234_t:CDS:1 n=1 Tax=Gigaspora margarita TaxID=4874 RepID=A0ABN7VSD3_GIGMA|nr:19234_t:CDS:2 [Gigaspora margarita]
MLLFTCYFLLLTPQKREILALTQFTRTYSSEQFKHYNTDKTTAILNNQENRLVTQLMKANEQKNSRMYPRIKAGVDYVVDTYRTAENNSDARVNRDNCFFTFLHLACRFQNGVLEVNPELVNTPITVEVYEPISRIFVIYRPTESEANLINGKLEELYS